MIHTIAVTFLTHLTPKGVRNYKLTSGEDWQVGDFFESGLSPFTGFYQDLLLSPPSSR